MFLAFIPVGRLLFAIPQYAGLGADKAAVGAALLAAMELSSSILPLQFGDGFLGLVSSGCHVGPLMI
ncbi:hypothetical protein [Kaistia nematophila]|uniref:Uncharacterized protein n=1 Tax=Kaistia nematophila TaxID=2994654 RepID=A0A9X3E8K8_9HYPH|nr:hypothetical protein [Kaistia nematophila]MCX5571498.1 hypothetical protein [Kaistia nematophila]